MTSGADWLSRLMRLLTVSGSLDHRCFLGAPWRIDYPAPLPGGIPFHIVLGGSVVLLHSEGGASQKLVAGDIVLITDGAEHALHDGSEAPPSPIRKRPSPNVTIAENDGTGERLDILCGSFQLSPAHEQLVRGYLPRRIVISAAENSAATAGSGTTALVAGLVSLMRSEAGMGNVGGMAMLDALSTALFALTLRLASEAGQATEGLLALAGNPRLAPALTAMFNDPARSWTLPDLSRLCNMSRATFIRHFQDKLGHSPAVLLADIRMTTAANALETSDNSTGAIAELVGYQSEAAFQRAFKQKKGVTPSQWRKRLRAGNAGGLSILAEG